MRRLLLAAILLLAAAAPARADRCDVLVAALAGRVTVDPGGCFESGDLTTANPATTPADNSIAALPPFAFTPRTDRGVIAEPWAGRRPALPCQASS
jgi:hypothetical protein